MSVHLSSKPPSTFIFHQSTFILHSATFKLFSLLVFFVRKTLKNPTAIFTAKYGISTAVMIVNPVRSPKVPPIAESILTKVVALSFVILVKTKSSKFNLIYLSPSLSSLVLFSKNITYYFRIKLYVVERRFCICKISILIE